VGWGGGGWGGGGVWWVSGCWGWGGGGGGSRDKLIISRRGRVNPKRVEEKWHNWYSTALFPYKTATAWGSTPGRPRVVALRGKVAQLVQYGTFSLQGLVGIEE